MRDITMVKLENLAKRARKQLATKSGAYTAISFDQGKMVKIYRGHKLHKTFNF